MSIFRQVRVQLFDFEVVLSDVRMLYALVAGFKIDFKKGIKCHQTRHKVQLPREIFKNRRT